MHIQRGANNAFWVWYSNLLVKTLVTSTAKMELRKVWCTKVYGCSSLAMLLQYKDKRYTYLF